MTKPINLTSKDFVAGLAAVALVVGLAANGLGVWYANYPVTYCYLDAIWLRVGVYELLGFAQFCSCFYFLYALFTRHGPTIVRAAFLMAALVVFPQSFGQLMRMGGSCQWSSFSAKRDDATATIDDAPVLRWGDDVPLPTTAPRHLLPGGLY